MASPPKALFSYRTAFSNQQMNRSGGIDADDPVRIPISSRSSSSSSDEDEEKSSTDGMISYRDTTETAPAADHHYSPVKGASPHKNTHIQSALNSHTKTNGCDDGGANGGAKSDTDDSLEIDLNTIDVVTGCDEDTLDKSSNGLNTVPTLAPDLSRDIRAATGRETPEANNLLVQLICSQKELKIPNWHDVLKAIQSNPDDVTKPHGWDAELPLHWAISEQAPLFITEALLDIYPDGAKAKGRYGALPLWYAIESENRNEKNSVDLINKLLHLHPHGAQKKLNHILPIVKAHQLGACESIIKALLKCDLPFTPTGAPNCFHTYSWAWILENTEDKYIRSIRDILDTHEAIVPLLARALDTKGNRVVLSAHKDVRELIYQRALFCGRFEIMLEAPPIHMSPRSVILKAVDRDCESSYLRAFHSKCTKGHSEQPDIIDSVGNFIMALQQLGGYIDMNRVDLSSIFSNCDGEKVSISRDEFVRYCRSVFGSPRNVAIKFMRNERYHLKERMGRKSCNLDSRYILPLIDDVGVGAKQFADAAAKTHLRGYCSLSLYTHGLFMPLAERDLQSTFYHDTLNQGTIGVIVRDIAQALQHLHSRGICHGDLRLRNVIRVGERYCLLDLTASSNLEIFYIQDADIYGSKLCTGYMPPEMFVPLTSSTAQQVSTYWKGSDNYEEMWRKVRPARSGRDCYAVRGFDVDKKTQSPRDLHTLPYRPALATAQLDMWSLGMILFALSSGENLLPVTCGDDLTCDDDMCTAALWTEAQLQARVDDVVSDPLAADLISMLLQPDPRNRPGTMKQVLDHVYFSGINNKRNSYIEQKIERIYTLRCQRSGLNDVRSGRASPSAPLPRRRSAPTGDNSRTSPSKLSQGGDSIVGRSHPTLSPIAAGTLSPSASTSRLRPSNESNITMHEEGIFALIMRTHEILRSGLFDGLDINIPTCFTILNQKILPVESKDFINSAHSESDDGKQDDSYPSSEEMLQVRRAQRWFEYICEISDSLSEGDRGVSILASALKCMCNERELYFYLVDEVTMLPVSSSEYPIRITSPMSFIPRVLPLLKVSLQAIAARNDINAFGICLGFPEGCIPPEVSSLHASECISDVDSSLILPRMIEQSGVLKYSVHDSQSDMTLRERLSRSLFGDLSEHRGVETHPLQELAEFYAINDTLNSFCGLTRVSLSDGSQVWTNREHVDRYSLLKERSFYEDEAFKRSDPEYIKALSTQASLDMTGAIPDGGHSLGSGKGVTAAHVNNNVLLIHNELLKLTLAVENLTPAEPRSKCLQHDGCCVVS